MRNFPPLLTRAHGMYYRPGGAGLRGWRRSNLSGAVGMLSGGGCSNLRLGAGLLSGGCVGGGAGSGVTKPLCEPNQARRGRRGRHAARICESGKDRGHGHCTVQHPPQEEEEETAPRGALQACTQVVLATGHRPLSRDYALPSPRLSRAIAISHRQACAYVASEPAICSQDCNPLVCCTSRRGGISMTKTASRKRIHGGLRPMTRPKIRLGSASTIPESSDTRVRSFGGGFLIPFAGLSS